MLIEVDESYICDLKSQIYDLQGEVDDLKTEVENNKRDIYSLNFRIETELKPRLKRERDSYDSWVTTDRSYEACEAFNDIVEELCDAVEENPLWYEWEDKDGDLREKILYLIKEDLKGENKMGKFVKPKHVVTKPKEYLRAIIEHGIEKDLHDNEEVCEHCCGTGIVLVDNRYGLKEESGRKAGMFPYTHQSLTFCPYCFNGVVHRCEFCGKILPKGSLKCDCETQLEIDNKELEQKRKALFDKAPLLPEENYKDYEYFYSEDYGYDDGYFSEFEEFFDYWGDLEYEEKKKLPRPEYVWVTEEVSMHIDAYGIVENETDELYEDAMHDVNDSSIEKLQKYLDKWCEDCGVKKSYFESHKYKVRIPWEDYDKNEDAEHGKDE